MIIIQDFVQTKKRAKKTVAANLSTDEMSVVQYVTKWRIENGYSRDQADCLRQMIHFVINKEYMHNYDFVSPTNDEILNAINKDNEEDVNE